MDQSAKFWDKIAPRYAKQPIADEAAYQKKLLVTREYFRPDMQVLEFGCGTGSTAISHAPFVEHIRATDISAKMIGIAQGKADSANVENVTFEQAAIDSLELPETSLDAVLGLNILHLLDNKDVVIARVHSALKPGGIFVTSTVCLGDSWMRYLAPLVSLGKTFGLLPQVLAIGKKELRDSLSNAGFDLDYQAESTNGRALFIVAIKREAA